MTSAGSIRGSIRISAKQAIAEYAALRAANATTRTALLSSSAVFAKVGMGALVAAAPIALLFKSAITQAATFQKKMDYFGAVTGASQKDMQAVSKAAMDMSRNTVYSAQEMADAMVEFGKAGFATKTILGGVAKATVDLAQAADISMSESANIMASQLSTFKMGAGQASHVADTLAGAANASIIDIQDIAYALRYAGGIAASTGVSFDTLVESISLLGKRGIRGSQAGTSLRMIMVSLLGTTAKATKELKKLGLITADGTNKFVTQKGHLKDLSQVFEILRRAEKGMTEAQQLQTNKTIFNTRALSAVQILMRDGAKGFRNMQQEMGKVKAADVARKRLDNLAGDWKKFTNNIKTMLIQVGGPMQNFLRGVVQWLTKLVKWFGALSPHMQKMIVDGLGIIGMFLIFVGTLSLFISMILRIIIVFKDLKMAFLLVRAFIMESLIPAFEALFVAMMSNPVFMIIAAVILLVGVFIYCWKHFKGFRDFFKAAWKDIQGFFIAAWHVINKVFRDIVGAVEAFGRGFMRYLVDPIVKAWDAVSGAFVTAYKAVSHAISAVIGFVKEHWKAIIAIILGPIGLVIDAITTHWKWISNFLAKVWHGIEQVARFVWGLILDYFKFQINAIKTVFTTVWNAITATLSAIWTGISDTAKAIWGGIVAVFRFVWNVIVSYFRIYTGVIKTILTTVWRTIGGPLKAFWNGVVKFFRMVWDRIYAIIKGIVTPIARTIAGLWRTITSSIANVATGIWNGIQATIGRVYKFLSGVVTGIFNTFNGLYNDMLVVGKNIIIGIWNGIVKLSGWLWSKVSHFLKNLWDNVLGFFGIHSPSKKGEYAGKMIIAGLVKGLEDSGAKPKDAMTRVAAGVATALKNAVDQLAQAKSDYVNNIRDVMTAIVNEASIANPDIGKIVTTDASGNDTTSYTAKSIQQGFQAKAAQVDAWANDIARLRKMGLSPALIDQFIQAGLDSMPQVEALLKASRKQIRSINASYSDITWGAHKVGSIDSQLMFKAGVDAARGLVRGLRSERKSLLAIAETMGKDMVKAVKAALGIKSPSTVMRDEVGQMMMRGLANGITSNKHLAVNAVLDANRAMMNAHTSSLETSVYAAYQRSGLAAMQNAALNNGASAMKSNSIGVNIEQWHSHNPVPERDSVTLPRKIRQLNYVTPGPTR